MQGPKFNLDKPWHIIIQCFNDEIDKEDLAFQECYHREEPPTASQLTSLKTAAVDFFHGLYGEVPETVDITVDHYDL